MIAGIDYRFGLLMIVVKRMLSVGMRWLPVGGLAWLIATVVCADTVTKGSTNDEAENTKVIAVELNQAKPAADGCRLSFVIRNRTPHAFESLQWDLVFFDADGLIAGRMGAEAAPLPAGKTSVKLFDVPGITCAGLRRVLINDVRRCETVSDVGKPNECLRLTVPSSRTDIELIK